MELSADYLYTVLANAIAANMQAGESVTSPSLLGAIEALRLDAVAIHIKPPKNPPKQYDYVSEKSRHAQKPI